MASSDTSAPARLSPGAASSLLREHGITPTRQRVEIASILLARPQHRSADELIALANGGSVRVSKATVYNNLRLFAGCGLVREVIVDPTKVFFDSNTRPHDHIYNVDTGELTDVDASEIEIGRLPDLPEGTEIEGVDVVVRVRNQRT